MCLRDQVLDLISTGNIHYLLVSSSECFTYFSTCMLMTHSFTNQIDPSNFENQNQTADQLHLCTCEISNWMSNNRLKLNEEKRVLNCWHRKTCCKVIIDSLNVDGIDIKPSTSVGTLGVIIHQDLSLKEQVNAICRS